MEIRMNSSRIIKQLSQSELSAISEELLESKLEWSNHYLMKTPLNAPLRHGSSIYVQSINVQTHEIIVDNKKYFSNSLKLLSEWTCQNMSKVARCYWHRLRPGERIDVHRDKDDENGSYFNKINRYQLFFEIPQDMVIVMDSELWNFKESKKISNSLIFFNHADWHYYSNNSNKDVQFLVIDFVKN